MQCDGARSESDMKAKIREYINLTLPECFVPELGEGKTGKVRNIYFSGENVVMVTNDRVSAFDYILPNLIPFKGQVLNMISEWAFAQTRDVIPNALVANVDSSVVVQKKMKNLMVEFYRTRLSVGQHGGGLREGGSDLLWSQRP